MNGDAVNIQTLLRPALLLRDICHAKIAEQPLRAKELNSTSSRDELRCSNQGLKCHEWLSDDWSSCDHCSHLCVGPLHLCSAQLCLFLLRSHVKSGLTADSLAPVPNCRIDTSALVRNCRMDTSEPVPNCRDISDTSRWCRSVLGPKCLGSEVSVHRHAPLFQWITCRQVDYYR